MKTFVKSFFVFLFFFFIFYAVCIKNLPARIATDEVSYSKFMYTLENDPEQISEIVIDDDTAYVKFNSDEESNWLYVNLIDSSNFMDEVIENPNSSNIEVSVYKTEGFWTYFIRGILWVILFHLLSFIGGKIKSLFSKFKKKKADNKKAKTDTSEPKPANSEQEDIEDGEEDENEGHKFRIFTVNYGDGKKGSSSTLKDFQNALMGKTDYTEDIETHIVKDNKITFADVAGMPIVKEAMRDVAEGILNAEKFEANGAKIPSGILMEGDPGTGKTLLARALAGEFKVPFIQYSATEMANKFVGESEEKIRAIFDYAKSKAPCILFFDEIDAIASSRKGNTASYEKTMLTQLLTCLDGFTPRDGVIFIAATNFVESLDEAIKRPGRFDRIIHVDLPNEEEREAILKVHARNKKLSDDIDLHEIAANSAGLSGAYLANIMNEAAILQIKANHPYITVEDINEAHRIVLFGPKSTKVMNDAEKHLTAIHELGHAFTSSERIKEISVIPRGQAGGYTWYEHEEESYVTATKIRNMLISLLGGRAAEEVILDDISTGAENDMERAFKLARDYIVKYGMSSKLGPISMKMSDVMSDETKDMIFNETKNMISEAYESAKKIISSNRVQIEALSGILEDKQILLGTEFYSYVNSQN